VKQFILGGFRSIASRRGISDIARRNKLGRLLAAQPNNGSAVRANGLIVADGFGPNPVYDCRGPEGKMCW
jgi:hypothetical protein